MKQFDIHSEETQQRVALILLGLCMLVYAMWMSYEVILRYDTFKATAFDLGNYDQALWNTIHGRLFQFTNQGVDWYGPPTRLAIHFEPILLPLSLLYLFHADPRILLVFQTLALTTGAWPIFALTRKYLPAWPLLAPVMAAAYLCMPALLGVNLFDFHPVSLATPLLLYAMLALVYRRYTWFLIACVLAAACKEEIPLSVALIGVLVIWKYKLPRLGTVLIIGGILWSTFAFMLISHFYPGAQHSNYWYRYESLGSSPGTALVNILLHPWLLFTTFITLDRFYYLASLLRSTGFLALLAPEWLLPTLPSLAINLLSINLLCDACSYSGVYHYNAAIIPFVMLAAIHGAQRLFTLWQVWRGEGMQKTYNDELVADMAVPHRLNRLARWLTQPAPLHIPFLAQSRKASIAFASPVMSPIAVALSPRLSIARQVYDTQQQVLTEHMAPLARNTSLSRLQWFACVWIIAMFVLNCLIMIPAINIFMPDHVPGSREQHIQQLLAMIPPNASVSASESLNPHLSDRLYVTVFPEITFSTSKNINNTVQYVIVDVQSIFPEDHGHVTDALNQLRKSQFRTLRQAEGVILLVRIDTT